jgi:hypothetical protein
LGFTVISPERAKSPSAPCLPSSLPTTIVSQLGRLDPGNLLLDLLFPSAVQIDFDQDIAADHYA